MLKRLGNDKAAIRDMRRIAKKIVMLRIFQNQSPFNTFHRRYVSKIKRFECFIMGEKPVKSENESESEKAVQQSWRFCWWFELG